MASDNRCSSSDPFACFPCAMPKKRTAAKSRKDEQTKETDVDSGSIFQEDDDAKRAKLEPLNDTPLQHLPIELLESILIKAVAMEVLELKVVRCARKEQADLVIGRLSTVCWQWDSVLATDIFRKEVHRLLEGEETIRFKILDKPSFHVHVLKLTSLKDELFLLCSPPDGSTMVINVYDRNNMTEVKDVILTPRLGPIDIAACNVSNCVYMLNTHAYYCPSLYRITKDDERHFKVSPRIKYLKLPITTQGPMSVAANGNLIIPASEQCPKSVFDMRVPGPGMVPLKPSCVGIFNASGAMQHKIILSPNIYGFRIINSVIQKSDGNLVLLVAASKYKVKLLEIDMTGRILRQYQSSLNARKSILSFADVHGRILLTNHHNRIKLFDRLFNPLEIADRGLPEDCLLHTPQIHFNSVRNEIVRIETLKYTSDNDCGSKEKVEGSVLGIFRLTNE